MTTSYSVDQTGVLVTTTIDTAIPLSASTISDPQTIILRFIIPENRYFISTLTLRATLTGLTTNPSTFFVQRLTDTTLHVPIASGVVNVAEIPEGCSASGLATGEAVEVGRTTITEDGTVEIDLDLADITEMMTSDLSYESQWSGSLVLWVSAAQDSALDVWSDISLVAYSVIDYANRDTGSRGIESSRWDRCPVTGLKIPRGKMVMDGYRNILVHPSAYDPPEPDPMEWDDIEEPNEGL